MMDYEKSLERAYENLPDAVLEKERFEVPKVRGHIQGNKTVIGNFYQIASTIRRPPEHLLKYILKELATPGDLKRNALMIGTKTSAARINEKIKKYVEEFVICKECGKPDTKLIKEGEFLNLKCQACGAKRIVKSKI
ncbi:MAG: translation initiation factor IF-2 subunit beta [Candidatus Woesearchaeota archaeon]